MKPLRLLSRALSRRVVAPATLAALLAASAGAGALLALTAPPPEGISAATLPAPLDQEPDASSQTSSGSAGCRKQAGAHDA